MPPACLTWSSWNSWWKTLGIRADRLLKRRLKQARFPALKTLEDFDFTYNPSIDKRQVIDLATARFVASAKGILLQGPPGTGKSHLAIALGIRAIHAGYPVLYRSALDLLEDLAEAEALDDRRTVLKNLVKAPLLIIDDLGLNRTPPGAAQNLMELFMRRYEQNATIVTTNPPAGRAEQKIVIKLLAEQTLTADRIKSHQNKGLQ